MKIAVEYLTVGVLCGIAAGLFNPDEWWMLAVSVITWPFLIASQFYDGLIDFLRMTKKRK